MQAVLIVAIVLACSQVHGGLLRVPRVYNALITTNEKLVPSRAISVSAPVLQPLALAPILLGGHAALVAAPEPAPAGNSSDPAPANKTAAPEPPAFAPLPLALYSTYNPYSYYSPLLPYSYHPPSPFVYTSSFVHPFVHFPLVPGVAAAAEGANKPAADAPEGSKDEPEKDAVSVEAN